MINFKKISKIDFDNEIVIEIVKKVAEQNDCSISHVENVIVGRSEQMGHGETYLPKFEKPVFDFIALVSNWERRNEKEIPMIVRVDDYTPVSEILDGNKTLVYGHRKFKICEV